MLEQFRPAIAPRFFVASRSPKPTAEQLAIVAELQTEVIRLAEAIDAIVPDGRNKSLALTALEDVHMRANRGVFAPPEHR